MNNISIDELKKFVNTNIDKFHSEKIARLSRLELREILKSKNPYLFKAKNLNTAADLINDLLAAFLSSSEEKLFGDFLEKLAIFISSKTYGGHKSSSTGVDLEFSIKDATYLVSVKSGSKWGNSTSKAKQNTDLQKALATVRQGNRSANVIPVIGMCYGHQRTTTVKGILNITGQNFWELISGDENLYINIVEPIGYRAKEHNDNFLRERARLMNIFTKQFIDGFCDDGIINWDKLVEFNSGNKIKSKQISN
ncbi:MAG: PmeII family type II restriction endonuclease [Candidatus Shapirobacteria bacterium]|nr:PmeII family type II restriction endonuclease [Candidatus Shapirobacteria bacterium]